MKEKSEKLEEDVNSFGKGKGRKKDKEINLDY